MSQPTPSSTLPDPVPPTPNPPTMSTGTPSPPTQPTSNPPTSLPTPKGPTLTEGQMMGRYALIAMGVKAPTIKKLESEDMDEFQNLLMVSKQTLDELKGTKGLLIVLIEMLLLSFNLGTKNIYHTIIPR